jgi:hypothetical protein
MYRAGSLRAVAEETLKYRVDLVGVQEVRWDGGCTEPAGEYTFFYGKGNDDHELGTGFSYIEESYQYLKRVEFVSDRISYIILIHNTTNYKVCLMMAICGRNMLQIRKIYVNLKIF